MFCTPTIGLQSSTWKNESAQCGSQKESRELVSYPLFSNNTQQDGIALEILFRNICLFELDFCEINLDACNVPYSAPISEAQMKTSEQVSSTPALLQSGISTGSDLILKGFGKVVEAEVKIVSEAVRMLLCGLQSDCICDKCFVLVSEALIYPSNIALVWNRVLDHHILIGKDGSTKEIGPTKVESNQFLLVVVLGEFLRNQFDPTGVRKSLLKLLPKSFSFTICQFFPRDIPYESEAQSNYIWEGLCSLIKTWNPMTTISREDFHEAATFAKDMSSIQSFTQRTLLFVIDLTMRLTRVMARSTLNISGEVATWIQRVEDLGLEPVSFEKMGEPDGVFLGLPKRMATWPKLREDVYTLYKEGRSLEHKYSLINARAPELTLLLKYNAQLKKVIAQNTSSYLGSEGKTKPVFIVLYGDPGQGKTVCVDHIMRDLCAARGEPKYNPSLDKYSYNPVSEYFEGYNYQKVFEVSDFMQIREKQSRVNELMNILHCADESTYCLNVAFEQKGTMYFHSQYIMLTTNLDPHIRVNAIRECIEFPEAFYRRINIMAKVENTVTSGKFSKDTMKFTVSENAKDPGAMSTTMTWNEFVAHISNITDQINESSINVRDLDDAFSEQRVEEIRKLKDVKPEFKQNPQPIDEYELEVTCINDTDGKCAGCAKFVSKHKGIVLGKWKLKPDHSGTISKSGHQCGDQCRYALPRYLSKAQSGDLIFDEERVKNAILGMLDGVSITVFENAVEDKVFDEIAREFMLPIITDDGLSYFPKKIKYKGYLLITSRRVKDNKGFVTVSVDCQYKWYNYDYVTAFLQNAMENIVNFKTMVLEIIDSTVVSPLRAAWEYFSPNTLRSKIRSLVFRSTVDKIVDFFKYVVLPAALGLLSILGVIKLWSWVFESVPDRCDYPMDTLIASDNQRQGHRPRVPVRGRVINRQRPRVTAALFDTDAQSVLHTFGGQRVIASQTVATAMEIAVHNIKPNIGLISTSAGTTNAVALREKFVLVPEHVIPEGGEDHVTMSFPGGKSFSFSYSEVNAVYSTANHFIVMDLSSLPKFKRMPAFSSIIRYMSVDVRTEVPDGFLFVGAQSGTSLCSIMKLATNIQGPAPTIVRAADRRFEVPECYSYRCPTQNGDCGAPLLTVIDSQPIILGFHISMFLPEQLAYAGAVSKTWWEEAVLREFVTQAQIKPVVTEFPSAVTYLDGPTPYTFLPRVSKLVRSDLWTEDCMFKPSPLKGVFDGKTPVQRSFEKSLRPIVHPDEEEFAEAVEELKMIYARPDYYPKEILTVEEAIFGVGDIPSFASRGGVGHPWNLNYKREDLFSYDDFYVSAELHNKCLQNMHQLRKGEKLDYVIVDMPKDEKLPIVKADQGKCRLFFVLPIDINITCKQVFGRFAQFIINLHNVGPVKVGHGTEAAEVRKLAQYLCLERDDLKYLTPDTAASDRSIPYVIFMQVVEVSNHWYGDDNDQIRGVLASSIFCCVHVLDGVKYETRAGMPSGFYLTSVFNSLAYFIAYHSCMRQLRVVIVAIAAFGDDIVLAVDKREPVTEQQVISKIKDYGLDITGVNKDEPLKYCGPSEVVFLQRTFEKRGGIWYSPMDLTRLEHQMMWYRKTKETRNWSKARIHEEIFRNAFHEFYQHGRKVFEQMLSKYSSLINFYEFNIGDYDHYHDCYMGGVKQHLIYNDEFSPTYGCHDNYFSEAQAKTLRSRVDKSRKRIRELKKENSVLKFENLKLKVLPVATNESSAQGVAKPADSKEQFLITHWNDKKHDVFVPKPITQLQFMNTVEKAGRRENESTLDYVRRCKEMRNEQTLIKTSPEVKLLDTCVDNKSDKVAESKSLLIGCWEWFKEKCLQLGRFLKRGFAAFLHWARSTFTLEDVVIAKEFQDLRQRIASLKNEEDMSKYQKVLIEVEALCVKALRRANALSQFLDEDLDGKKQTWYEWMAVKLRNFLRKFHSRYAFLDLQRKVHVFKQKKVTAENARELFLRALDIQYQCEILEKQRGYGVGTYVIESVKSLHGNVLAAFGILRFFHLLPSPWMSLPVAVGCVTLSNKIISETCNSRPVRIRDAIMCVLKCFGTGWYNELADLATFIPFQRTLPILRCGMSCSAWIALRPLVSILGPFIEEIGFEKTNEKLAFGLYEFCSQVYRGTEALWRIPALICHLGIAYGAAKGMDLTQRIGIHSTFNIVAAQIEMYFRPSQQRQLVKTLLYNHAKRYGTPTQAFYVRQATALLFTGIKDEISLSHLGIGLVFASVISGSAYILNKIRIKEEKKEGPIVGSLLPTLAVTIGKCFLALFSTAWLSVPLSLLKIQFTFLLNSGLPFSYFASFVPGILIAGPICEEYLFDTFFSKTVFAIIEYISCVVRGKSAKYSLLPVAMHMLIGFSGFSLLPRILLHMLGNLIGVIAHHRSRTPQQLQQEKENMLVALKTFGTASQYEHMEKVEIPGLVEKSVEEVVTPEDLDLPTETTTEAVVHGDIADLPVEVTTETVVHESEAQMDSTLAAQTNIGEVEATSSDVNLTRFVEMAPAETGCVPSSEYPIMDSGFEWEPSYCKELERVVKIADFALDDTPKATPYRFNGAVEILNQEYIANRFYQAVGARFDIEYQIRVVVTKFHYGQIMALVRPALHQNQANLVGVATKSQLEIFQDDWCGYDSVYTASQCEHVVIPLTHGPPVTLCAKWHYPFNWIYCMLPSVDPVGIGKDIPAGKFTNLLKFGVLDIYNLTGAHPAGMTDPRVCVWARFKNLRLFGYNAHIPRIALTKIGYPAHLSIGQAGEAEELAQDSWSATITGVADVVGGFVKTFTNVLAFFGLSNPRREGGPTPMVGMQYPTATSYGDSPAISLSYRLDDKQPSLLDDSGKNELLLTTLAAKPTYFGCEFLTNTDREFAFLVSMAEAHAFGNGHVISPAAFIKRFFKLARSDIKIKFHFSASAVVNTRVWITAIPRALGIWGESNTPYKVSASPDISGDVIYEMNLPYMEESQYTTTGPVWFITVSLTTDIISTDDTEVKPIPVTIWYSFPNAEFAVSSVPQVDDHSTYLSYLPIYQARPSGRVSRGTKSVLEVGPFGYKGKMIGESLAQSLPKVGTTVHPNNHGLACSPTSILHVMKRFSTVTGIPDKPCSLRPMRPHYGTVNTGTTDKPYNVNYVTGGAFHMFLLMFKYVHGGTNLIHTTKSKKDIGVVLSEAAFDAGDASATPVADISHNMVSAGGYMFDEGDVKMMAHVPYRARTPFSFVETPIFGKDTFSSQKKEWMFKASLAQYPVLAEAGFWGVSAADDLEPFLFIGVPALKVTNVT